MQDKMTEKLNYIFNEFKAANELKREIESKGTLDENDKEQLEIIENFYKEFRKMADEWGTDYNRKKQGLVETTESQQNIEEASKEEQSSTTEEKVPKENNLSANTTNDVEANLNQMIKKRNILYNDIVHKGMEPDEKDIEEYHQLNKSIKELEEEIERRKEKDKLKDIEDKKITEELEKLKLERQELWRIAITTGEELSEEQGKRFDELNNQIKKLENKSNKKNITLEELKKVSSIKATETKENNKKTESENKDKIKFYNRHLKVKNNKSTKISSLKSKITTISNKILTAISLPNLNLKIRNFFTKVEIAGLEKANKGMVSANEAKNKVVDYVEEKEKQAIAWGLEKQEELEEQRRQKEIRAGERLEEENRKARSKERKQDMIEVLNEQEKKEYDEEYKKLKNKRRNLLEALKKEKNRFFNKASNTLNEEQKNRRK